MKKTRKFIVLAVTILVAVSMCTNAFAYSTVLSVKKVTQAKTNWCWAASAEMAGGWAYGNSTRTQWDVVKHVKGTILTPYPNAGGSLADSENGSEYMCYDETPYNFSYAASSWTMTSIRYEIQQSRPLETAVGYYDSNGNEQVGIW